MKKNQLRSRPYIPRLHDVQLRPRTFLPRFLKELPSIMLLRTESTKLFAQKTSSLRLRQTAQHCTSRPSPEHRTASPHYMKSLVILAAASPSKATCGAIDTRSFQKARIFDFEGLNSWTAWLRLSNASDALVLFRCSTIPEVVIKASAISGCLFRISLMIWTCFESITTVDPPVATTLCPILDASRSEIAASIFTVKSSTLLLR